MGRVPGKIIVAIMVVQALALGGSHATKAAEKPAAFPIVPGYHILKDSGKVDLAAQGELLLGELNCVACHGTTASSRVLPKGGPDLSRVGARISPQYLQRYLADPHAIKPGTTMPDLLHGMPSDQKVQAVESLTHFLASKTGGGSPSKSPMAGTPELVKEGQELYSRLGCGACHAPEKAKETKIPSVPLGDLAEKTTVAALSAFLLDPTQNRPAGRMPAMGLTPLESRALAVYLLRKQTDNPIAATQPIAGTGLHVDYYEGDFKSADPEKFAALNPHSKADVTTINLEAAGRRPKSKFGLKFTGWICIPQDGKYTFTLKSDDGSILYIDNKLVVNYDGIHPPKPKAGTIELTSGMYPIQLTYFQNGGGAELSLLWSGPNLPEEQVPADAFAVKSGKAMVPLKGGPFTIDPEKVKAGEKLFASLGCASCHAMKDTTSELKPKDLVQLKLDSTDGCLAEKVGTGRPNFDLSPDQKQAIVAAMKNASTFTTPREPAAQVIYTMAAMNCVACHQRNEIGGVGADRNELFRVNGGVDVGDEGRLPPRLTGVGAKLQPAAIERIVFDRQLHVRPYMATRMPNFSRAVLAGLPDLLAKADAASLGSVVPAKVVTGEEKTGRTLVGVRGLGCVNCHGVKGAKSLGAPSVDLSLARERLQPAWFAAYLADPNKLNPGTRMPAFWQDGVVAIKELAGGTFEGQANAIWSYLQQVQDLPLPDGLRLNGSDELTPGDEPIVLRAFVTGVSPRAILVGNPEGIHWVFDANTVRLAKAWHGRFFDAKGIWEARGGRAEPPMGKDVIDMPTGPSFAVLDSLAAPWPATSGEFDRNIGGRFLGYRLDEKQRPTFRYSTDAITVEEKPVPKGTGEHASLERQFTVTGTKPVKDLFFLVASGKKIESKQDGVWVVDGTMTIRLNAPGLPAPQTRDGKDGVKLLVMPVEPSARPLSFLVEVSW